MGDVYRTECPAKLNLYLKIGEPDERGYHPVNTGFQAISLCDTLQVTVGGSGLEVVGQDLPSDNTVTKALRLLREIAPVPTVRLRLVKRIPSGAGLGGGSSDAAGLIRIVQRIVGPLPEHEVLSVAASVGADVPFFLTGGQAVGTGYGEIIEPLLEGSAHWLDDPVYRYVLAMPPIVCPTPEMYQRLDAARREGKRLEGWKGRIDNDFHLVAPRECLDLIEALECAGLTWVGMTGSGSVVFGQASSEAEAVGVAKRLGGQAWPVRALTRAESLAVTVDSGSAP